MIRLLRKYRRKGAVCIASTKLCQRSSPGSQENLAISRSLLSAVSTIHRNGTTISTAPMLSVAYSATRPSRSLDGFELMAGVMVTLVIGIRLLDQASEADEGTDLEHHHHR